MQQAIDRNQTTLARVIQILGQYRCIIGTASEKPSASGSGVLFLEADTGCAYFDDPDTSAWIDLIDCGAVAKPPSPGTEDHIMTFDASGDAQDSGVDIADVLLRDGTIALTANWAAGTARQISVGTVKGGDGTNQVSLSKEGLYLEGTATMWDDLRVPVLSTRVPAIGGPGFAKWLDNGSGSTGVFLYWFSPTSEESVYFVAQMPHRWKEGSDIEVHVHWVPKTNALLTPTDVCWGLEYTWQSINGTFGNTTIIYGDEQTNGSGEYMTKDKHYLTELGTITGSGQTMSSMLVCRLFRDATGVGGTDDYGNDAGLMEIDFHHQIDSLGSKEEYVKGP
jgi:hypothetical protein